MSAGHFVNVRYCRSVGLGWIFEELTRCSLFNYFAQPHKLIYALIWLHVTPTFKIWSNSGQRTGAVPAQFNAPY